MVRRLCLLPLLFLATSCAIGRTFDALADRSPPPEFGRPGWVRVPARVGAWFGGACGAVVSVVLLPITWPLSSVAGEGLGASKDDVMLFPAIGGAACGHAFIGLPLDFVDYTCRRMWVKATPLPSNGYELQPMAEPVVPAPLPKPKAVEAPSDKP